MRISDWSSDVCSSDLVRPLGFDLDDKKLKRAGLDYHEWTRLQIHDDLQLAFDSIGGDRARRFALTTKGARLRGQRSEERRVGKECGRTCSSWWTPYP